MSIFKRTIRGDLEINKLEKWLKNRGYNLKKSKTTLDKVDFETKIVFLNTRSKIENQIWSLLHECSHLAIRRNKKKFYKDFRILIELENKQTTNRPLRFYALEIEDETKAWRQGIKIAKSLKIPVNEDAYFKYASKYIFSYMVHAVASRKGS